MFEAAISDHKFGLFQRLTYKIAGISPSDARKALNGITDRVAGFRSTIYRKP